MSTSKLTETIGSRLRKERDRLKLGQYEFAKNMNISARTQSLYENNEGTPNCAYLLKAHEIGVDIYYVITGKRFLLAEELTSKEYEILMLIRSIAKKDK